MKKHILAIALLTFTMPGFAQTVDQLIRQTDIDQTVRTLSSDQMQGRSNFTSGIQQAASFIENEFKQIGLKPLPGNNDYRQKFSLIHTTPLQVSVTINHTTVSPENWLISSNGSFHWNEKTPVKIIHIAPGKAFIDEYLSILRTKQNALVFVDKQYETFFRHFQESLEQNIVTFKNERPSAQVFIIGDYSEPSTFSIDYEAKNQELPLANIAGLLPGKTKPNEYVIFSGHYDHLGILKPVDQDSIANGADDDASGTSAVIALAQYYKKLNNNARSIIFITFAAEEVGELGSQYFATHINPNRVVCMFNFELIGLTSKFGARSAFITGFERSDFGEILQRNLKGYDFKFYADPYAKFDLFYRSDNASLARLGVPAHTISTDPIDVDKYYHTVKDEISTLNLSNLTTTIRAVAVSSESIINGKNTPSRIAVQ